MTRRGRGVAPKQSEPAGENAGTRVGVVRSSGDGPTYWAFGVGLAAAFSGVALDRALASRVGAAGASIAIALGLATAGLMAWAAPRARLWARPRLGAAAGAWSSAVAGVGAIGWGHASLAAPVDLALGGLLASLFGAGLGLCQASVGQSGNVASRFASGLGGVVSGLLVAMLVVLPNVGFEGAAYLGAAMLGVLGGLAAISADSSRAVGGAAAFSADSSRAVGGAAAFSADSSRAPPSNESGELADVMPFAAASAFLLSLPTLWVRTALPYAGASTVSAYVIVAVALGVAAMGFLVMPRVPRQWRSRGASGALAASMPLAVVALAAVGLAQPSSRDALASEWLLTVVLVVVCVVGAPSYALGVAQAGSLDAIERSGDAARGFSRALGLGLLLAGAMRIVMLAALPAAGPRWTLVLIALPAVVALHRRDESRAAGIAFASAGLLAALAPGPRWFLGVGWSDDQVIAAEIGTRETSAVVRTDLPAEPRLRRLISGGVSQGGDSLYAQRTARLLAHLPALVSAGTRNALLLRVGPGVTLDALTTHPFEHIDAVDSGAWVHGVLAAFEHANHRAQRDPRVRLVEGDELGFLRRSADAYDVIVLASPPARAPLGSAFYSRETYEHARARLRAGGVVAQSLPLHDASGDELVLLIRTFAQSFPHVALHLVERNEAVLLGSEAEMEAHVARADLERVRLDLRLGFAERDPVLETRWTTALGDAVGPGAVLTDAWPLPELAPVGIGGASDAVIERVLERSNARGETYASTLGPAVPAFVRVDEHRAQEGDRESVRDALLALLRRDPDDPYLQHCFAYGALLEERLERLRGEMSAEETERVRAVFEARRRAVGEQMGAE